MQLNLKQHIYKKKQYYKIPFKRQRTVNGFIRIRRQNNLIKYGVEIAS